MLVSVSGYYYECPTRARHHIRLQRRHGQRREEVQRLLLRRTVQGLGPSFRVVGLIFYSSKLQRLPAVALQTDGFHGFDPVLPFCSVTVVVCRASSPAFQAWVLESAG